MTREEALKVLDTIPTIGEEVDALEMAIKSLEQELILDKIRAEIEQLSDSECDEKTITRYSWNGMKRKVFDIIDKYKAESTSNCNSCEHKNEVDGSNCYECVKGIRNNYTAESEE